MRLGADAIPALLVGLEELDWETRAFSASALAHVGTRAEAAALADAYDAETKFIESQRQIILAVSAIGAASSKDVLLRAADHADAGVRVAAVRGLGQLADKSLLAVLRKHAASEDLDIRYEALGALAQLEDKETIQALIDEAKATVANKKLERVDSLNQEDNGERYSHYLLGLALARSKDSAAQKIVVGAMLADKPWDHKSFLRMGAAEGLGRRAKIDGKAHPKLVSGISHKSNDVRVACSYAAGWAELPALVPKLVKALGDSQLDVRHNAVMALGRIPDAAAAKALSRAISDNAGEIRIGAVRALQGIDSPESTKLLLKVTRDGKYMIRVMAVRALRYRTEQDGVVAALSKSAKDSDYGVREQALASLAHHPDGEAVKAAIAGALKDRDYGVQTNACLGLARIADSADLRNDASTAKRVVFIYLEADQKRLEKAALECLDAVRPGGAVDPLIAGLGSAVEEQRRRANLALQTIGETSFAFKHDGPAKRPHRRNQALERMVEGEERRSPRTRRTGTGGDHGQAVRDRARPEVEGPRHRAAVRLDLLDGRPDPSREGTHRRDRSRTQRPATELARQHLHVS